MDTKTAEMFAWQDAKSVTQQAQRLCDGGLTSHEAEVLVDGTQFSPSWRALPGGEQVWLATDTQPASVSEAAIDAYTETLDGAVGTWAGEHGGEHLTWHDGMLWVCGEDFTDFGWEAE